MYKFKNILLVYPKIPSNTYWSFLYSLKFINKKTALPPLGLITVASIIPENYNTTLIDMNIEKLLKKHIKKADIIFISAMIVQKDSMNKIINMCKEQQKPCCVGGPYAKTAFEEENNASHYVIGEAEDILPEFLADLESGTAKKVYTCIKKPDLSNSAIPRFDLLKINKYASMSVQYSRGCPFKCEFCDIWITYGNKPRLKTAQNLLKELDYLYSLGWRSSVFLVDDNFIGNKKRLKTQLLPRLIKWQKSKKYPFTFYTEASINMAEDEELMDLMAEAKIDQVFIGIETPSKEALEETGKKQNLKGDLKESVIKIQKHGIEVTAGFILGFDSEKEDIFERQAEFIQQAAIPKAMIGIIQALPGTLLYQRLEKEGRLKGHTTGSNTHCISTNVVTVMDPETLKNGYNYVLSKVYDKTMKNYFQRCSLLLDNLKTTSYTQRKIRVHEIRAFFMSLLTQPFKPYGIQYIKFIIRNLRKNPKLFAEAITHSIMGHHFYTITRQMLKADKEVRYIEDIYNYVKTELTSKKYCLMTAASPKYKYFNQVFKESGKRLKKAKASIKKLPGDFSTEVYQTYLGVFKKINEIFSGQEFLSHKK
jgi:radical SAM superfamily enzyme YgiQ (UPF0313 family)